MLTTADADTANWRATGRQLCTHPAYATACSHLNRLVTQMNNAIRQCGITPRMHLDTNPHVQISWRSSVTEDWEDWGIMWIEELHAPVPDFMVAVAEVHARLTSNETDMQCAPPAPSSWTVSGRFGNNSSGGGQASGAGPSQSRGHADADGSARTNDVQMGEATVEGSREQSDPSTTPKKKGKSPMFKRPGAGAHPTKPNPKLDTAGSPRRWTEKFLKRFGSKRSLAPQASQGQAPLATNGAASAQVGSAPGASRSGDGSGFFQHHAQHPDAQSLLVDATLREIRGLDDMGRSLRGQDRAVYESASEEEKSAAAEAFGAEMSDDDEG